MRFFIGRGEVDIDDCLGGSIDQKRNLQLLDLQPAWLGVVLRFAWVGWRYLLNLPALTTL